MRPHLPDLLSRLRKCGVPRRAASLVFLLGLLSGCLLAAALLHLRNQALHVGEQATRSLAHLVGEQTTRSLQAVRQALELSLRGIAQLRAEGRLNEHSARALLRKQLDDLPFVRAIWVVDERGIITLDSDVGNIGLSLADRDYFHVHVEQPATEFFVGKPVRSRSLGTLLVSASLPIRSSDDAFQGVIAAAIEPPYFDRLWRTVDVGVGGSINLFTRDGVLLMRSPYLESAIGQAFGESAGFVPLVRLKPAGTLSGPSAIDGITRIVSFRQLAEHPDLVVVVGSPHDTVLKAWRQFAAVAIGTWVVALVAAGALCVLWIREWERRLRSEERSHQAQKMESIGTLAGGVAHDFNNILAAILGNVAIARSEIANAPAAQAAIEQIHQSGLRARELVRQILSFSRGQPHEPVHVEVGALVDETLALLRATLPTGVDLVRRGPELPLHVLGDATQLQQVLVNLCTNAWQALRGAGRIEVGWERMDVGAPQAHDLGSLRAGDHVHLWVADTGSGIAPELQPRIFEPFFTTKPKGEGTGLGLSVVHGILSAHHGAIRVDSEPDRGSTFHVYLPLAAGRDEASKEREPQGALAEGQGQCVMYVDDDDVILVMVKALLERSGFRVATSTRADDALARVRAHPAAFDVVVTDYDMPAMTGLELARELTREHPGLPVIISSGYISDDLREKARAAGVRELLNKENSYADLVAAVSRATSRAS